MGLREDGDKRLGAEHLGAEIALADRWSQESEVERAVDELRDLRRGQQLAVKVELDAGGGPVEEGFPELGFEAADLLRERWLRDVKPCGSSAEVPFLGHGDEV